MRFMNIFEPLLKPNDFFFGFVVVRLARYTNSDRLFSYFLSFCVVCKKKSSECTKGEEKHIHMWSVIFCFVSFLLSYMIGSTHARLTCVCVHLESCKNETDRRKVFISIENYSI